MDDQFRTIEEKLQQAGKSVRLSDVEKAHGRAELIRTMNASVPTPFWKYVFHMNLVRYGAVPLLIVMIIMGGVTTVSADTLPGDALYAVKTQVYEPVRALAIFDEEKRLIYEKELAERRLQEIVELAEDGDVSEEAQEQAFMLFDVHRKKAEERAQNISLSKEIAVQSELESELRAHGRVFADLKKDDLQEKIQDRITTVVLARSESEAMFARSSENLRDVLDEKEQEAQEKVALSMAQLDEGGDEQIRLQTAVQISLAEEAIDEAKQSTEAGSFVQAVLQYEKAKRFAQEAGRVFELKNRFAIAPRQIALERVEMLEEKTKAPEKASALMSITSADSATEDTEEKRSLNVYEYFERQMSSQVRSATPDAYMNAYPGLFASDFKGVISNGGIYKVEDGEVLFVPSIDTEDDVPAEVLESEGHIRLLINVATRLGYEISSHDSIDLILSEISRTQRTSSGIHTDTETSTLLDDVDELEEVPDDLELPVDF